MLRPSLAACTALALTLAVCRAGDDPSAGPAGPSSFKAGCFLVASPAVHNPPFDQVVILVLRHDGEGTLGLIVNHRTAGQIGAFTIYQGGPCPAAGPLMLHGQPEWLGKSPEQWKREIAAGICVGDDEDWKRATEATGPEQQRVRVFSGYAGWAPGQLERERAAGVWTVVPATGRLLFDTPADDLWEQLSKTAAPAKAK
jgi:putative transcriptional regulator